jgi:hypothetical protein
VICCFALNFHGIAFHLTPWSQKIVNGVVKHTYDVQKNGQDATTVLLFREEDLAALNVSYPVPVAQHAQVLDWLSRYNPRAVFVDFAFIDRKPLAEVKQLSDAICRLKRAGTPVYLAVVEPPTHTPPAPGAHATDHAVTSTRAKEESSCYATRGPMTPIEQTESTLIEPSSVLLECAIPVSVKMQSESGVSGVLTYSNGTGAGLEFLPAPAFAMASPELPCCSASQQRRPPPGVGRLQHCVQEQRPMEIVWANGIADFNKKWMDCSSDSPSHALFESLHHDWLAVKLPCPYTRTISVAHLKNSLPPHPHPPEFLDLDVFFALNQKAVFYGAGFQLAGDILISPVYQALPAVYLHAMAYDNLTTYGLEYKRADREAVSGTNRLAWWVDLSLLVLIVVILLFMDSLVSWLKRENVRPLFWWLTLGASILLVTEMAAIGVSSTPGSLARCSGWMSCGWASFVAVPVLTFVLSVLFLSTEPRDPLAGFFRRGLGALVIVVCAWGGFVFLNHTFGLDTALLGLLLAYFLYKLLVARDALAVATAILLVFVSVISYWPFNLGPRNVVAYLLVFELARHIMEHAPGVAERYFMLARWRGSRRPGDWMSWPLVRDLFGLLQIRPEAHHHGHDRPLPRAEALEDTDAPRPADSVNLVPESDNAGSPSDKTTREDICEQGRPA